MKNISKIRTGIFVKIFTGSLGYIALMSVVFWIIFKSFSTDELEAISQDELMEFIINNPSIFTYIAIIMIVICILMCAGSLITFIGLKGIMKKFDSAGQKGIARLSTAYMLNTISYVLLAAIYLSYTNFDGTMNSMVESSIIPQTVAMIVAIVNFIIAFVMKIVGYSTLRTTTSLGDNQGIERLYKGFMFHIICFIGLFIPAVGIYIFLALLILSWVRLLSGWAKVRESLRLNELNK